MNFEKEIKIARETINTESIKYLKDIFLIRL